MHLCCCIYFILWCGYICFILIDLVLENIYIEANKERKEKKKTVYLSYLAARWPLGPRPDSLAFASVWASPARSGQLGRA
jgi:hypothetical protein